MNQWQKVAQGGFSLVELMVAGFIVIILSSISVSYYGEHVKSGYRGETQSALLQLANAMERFKTENTTFVGVSDDSNVPLTTFFPATAPIGGKQIYNLTIEATASTYLLTATPRANAAMEGDGAFTLDEDGQKTFRGINGWKQP